ncbi:MAG: tripartite tricarboxylate transporter substrate binding protein [Pseudomonadota bacterium]|nr:tripartite tricarboxylate transporter substrate binding protein [Pseudomonadota bacterium]
MNPTRRLALASTALAACLAWSGLAQAQTYPAKTITIVVPFSAGGGVDAMARLLAEELRASLKQNVIVDNKPGASGMIGARAVAKAKPDGYTLLMGSAGETAINPFVYKGRMGYDPATELIPVALVSKVPNVLVASKSFAPNTVAELVAYAKQHPDQVVYSSSGVGNPQHLNGALLAQLAGIELVHAPYKGASGQLVDVVAGTVPLTFVSYAAARSFIADGKVKPLAVTSAKRTAFAPNIPALSEYPPLANYELANWFGVFAPARTPDAVLQTLNQAINAALKKPELAKRLQDQGGELSPMDLAQFRSFVQAESAKFQRIVQSANIQAD